MREQYPVMGRDFHREVHARLDSRFRADLAIKHMMKELDVPGPLARSLVMREPLQLIHPKILIPYVRLALPEGTLSSLRTIDYTGHNGTLPVVRMSLNSRDLTSVMDPDTPVDVPSQSDPLEVAELYMNLCRPQEQEDPASQDLVVMTRHHEDNDRSVVRCRRLRSEDAISYRGLGQGRLEDFVPNKAI